MLKGSVSKTAASYWSTRVFRHDTGHGKESTFSVKIQFEGRRERFSLGTASREIAATNASEIYRVLKTSGWDAAISMFKKGMGPIPKSNALTIGRYLEKVRDQWTGTETTLNLYVRAIRKIVSDIEGLDPGKSRFDYQNDGVVRWHHQIDQVTLASITDAKVNKWAFDFLKEAGRDHVARNKRKISINSYLRNAKSLFSDRVVKSIGLELPSPLPFSGAGFFGGVDQRYFSQFDIRKLLTTARDQLAALDPDAYSVVLLAAFGGLRRSEIDLLEWPSIDLQHGVLQLRITKHFNPKTPDSLRPILLRETWVLDWFKDLQRKHGISTGYVLAPNAHYTGDQSLFYYRCKSVFERVTRWLRSNGVKGDRPLHILRKEAGSDIVKRTGLISGAAFLRHKTPAVTALHYSDYRIMETPSFGDIYSGDDKSTKDNVIPYKL